MQYLVQMRLASGSRPTTQQDGIIFIEQLVLPTLDLCKKLQDERKLLAGGPMSGTVGLLFIVKAESPTLAARRYSSVPQSSRLDRQGRKHGTR